MKKSEKKLVELVGFLRNLGLKEIDRVCDDGLGWIGLKFVSPGFGNCCVFVVGDGILLEFVEKGVGLNLIDLDALKMFLKEMMKF